MANTKTKSTAKAGKGKKTAAGATAAKANAAWGKKEKALRKSFPDLTDNDLTRYAGEEDESILRRVAERTGKTYEEVVEIAG